MEMAARSFDLTRALLDLIPASKSLIDIRKETYDWLVRERVDERSFTSCREMAKNLAFPNENGLKLSQSIKDADSNILQHVRQAPIRLIVSGSLGRLLNRDEEVCYMVTTVAALSKYHDPQFAAKVLSAMVFDKGGHEQGVKEQKYQVQKLPIEAVIVKIVESIYVNVVNAGHTLDTFPEELQHLHHHILPNTTLAAIIMGIQDAGPAQNILIRSDRFLADLTSWLFAHFDGRIEISVDKTVLYSVMLGFNKRTLTMMIRSLCPKDHQSCWTNDAFSNVEACYQAGNNFKTFLSGVDDNQARPSSFTRHGLYVTTNFSRDGFATGNKTLNSDQHNEITIFAQKMMTWLLNLQLKVLPGVDIFLFQAVLTPDDKPSQWKIKDLLERYPGLLNFRTGISSTPGYTFRPPEASFIKSFEFYEEAGQDDKETQRKLIECFPFAESLLEDLLLHCRCPTCKSKEKFERCKKGCLRHAAVTELFMLLAHGITDVFGVDDVSGYTNTETIVSEVTDVLSEVIFSHKVYWDTWFRLVAALATGVPWQSLAFNPRAITGEGTEGASAWAALQYESIVVTASWVDLENPARIKGCFAVTCYQANVQGIPDDFGIIQCETADSEISGLQPQQGSNRITVKGMPAGQSQTVDLSRELRKDRSTLEILTAVFRSGVCRYRLVTTVKAGGHIRI